MNHSLVSPVFQLNDADIPFTPGQTLMQAALQADVYIPHLCFHPGLSPHGSCRLCLVEVTTEDAQSSPAQIQTACTFPAQTGLIVISESPRLQRLRKGLIQMLFIEGNHICPSCEFSGHCQLQAIAYALDMREGHFHFRYPKREQDASHPDIFLDRDRCINCELCCRASTEQDQKQVFSLGGRGTDTYLGVNSDTGQLGDSSLQLKDHAAHICPVGALMLKQQAYTTPIGQRLYDQAPITQVGNKRPEDDEK